jgi:hypothetical protein
MMLLVDFTRDVGAPTSPSEHVPERYAPERYAPET